MKKIVLLLALLLVGVLPLSACDDLPNDYYYDGDIDFDDSRRPTSPSDGGERDPSDDQQIGDNHPTDLPCLPVE